LKPIGTDEHLDASFPSGCGTILEFDRWGIESKSLIDGVMSSGP
jgi:hypothetical protein